MVAGKVALNYHGRGLNGRQREAVSEKVSSSSLNTTQKEEVTRAVNASGLSPRQVSELCAKLLDIPLWRMVSAQRAAITARDFLMPRDYGIRDYLVVLQS